MGDRGIKVSATCVRVPVLRAHSESVWIETEKEITPEKARELLSTAKGVEVIDNPAENKYPMPLFAQNQQKTFVGRIRKDISTTNGLTFWVVSDNLLKGAALNAVEIAEMLVSKGIHDLDNQTKALGKGEPLPAFEKFPYQIAYNVLPHIDVFEDNGYTKEEMKMTNETMKIMGDKGIKVSATCVRVPVLRAHSESVWIETEKEITPEKARELLSVAKGVEVIDKPAENKYPMPLFAQNQQKTFVGRIRKDISCNNGLTFWVVSDNLLKGAALNAVEIAEMLVARNIL